MSDVIPIFHLADLHGHLEKVPKLATILERERQRVSRSLFFDCGDTFGDNAICRSSGGAITIELMNLLEVDGWVPGNHELNAYGPAVLEARSRDAYFPFIAANVSDAKSGHTFPCLKSSLLKRVGGVTFGVIGLTRDYTGWEELDGVRFANEVESTRKEIKDMQDQADIVVVLSHLGFQADCQLAKEVPDIDIILGGHSHTVLPKGELVNGVLICHCGCDGTHLGHVDISSQGKVLGSGLIAISDKSKDESFFAELIPRLEATAVKEYGLHRVIGSAKCDFNNGHSELESNFGNLMTDLVRKATNSEIAFVPKGALAPIIEPGEITLRHIYDSIPLDDGVVVMNLSGATVRRLVDASLAEPYFHLYQSGLQVVCVPQRDSGKRVTNLLIGKEPLVDERVYQVACTTFTARGGPVAATVFAFLRDGKPELTRFTLTDLLLRHIHEQNEIEAKIDGRIKVLSEET